VDAAAFDAPKRGPVSRKADRNVQGRLTTTPGGRSKSRDPGASPCAMGRRRPYVLERGGAGALVPCSGGLPKGRPPGVSRSKPLKPLRAERRMCPVLSWWLTRALFITAHEAADASRVRRSARPLKQRAGRSPHSSDVETRREIAKVYLATASRGRRRKYRRTVPCTKVALRRCRSSHLRFATFYCSRGAGKFARRIV